MALILNEKYKGKSSYLHFLKNRFLKIYPLYFFVLFLTFLFVIFWHSLSLSTPIDHFFKNHKEYSLPTIGYIIFENISIFTQDIGSFLDVNAKGNLFFAPGNSSTYPFIYVHSLIPQAWTLGIELLFYISSPLFVKRSTRTLFLFIGLSFLLRFAIYSAGFHHEPWTNKFMPTELVFFLIGIFSYKLYDRVRNYNFPKSLFYIAYLFIVLFTVFYNFIPLVPGLINATQWIYFMSFALLVPFCFKFFKNNNFDRWIGELSYPIYISHVFVIYLVRNSNVFSSQNQIALFSISLTVLFSIMLLGFFSIFIENLRKD